MHVVLVSVSIHNHKIICSYSSFCSSQFHASYDGNGRPVARKMFYARHYFKDTLESNFTIEFAVLTIANTVQVILKRHINVHNSSFHLRQLRPNRRSVSQHDSLVAQIFLLIGVLSSIRRRVIYLTTTMNENRPI